MPGQSQHRCRKFRVKTTSRCCHPIPFLSKAMPWSHHQVPREDAEKEAQEGSDEQDDEGEEETISTPGPVVALLIGMAGSGKSTLFHRIHYEASQKSKRCYFINLDPATLEVPIEPNMDIRDTVDYKGVMREYTLGPNGAIMTSLNLYATQFSDVMDILDKRAADFDYVVIDTPGQIEAFTWSASGQLIAESLASTFATCIVYVVDTPRSRSPATFMSNMLYACSILQKLRLPLVAAFNKSDVQSPSENFLWMTDFEAFHKALDEDDSESYVTSLHRSMSLVLDEFYKVLDHLAVSAATGDGIDDLWSKLDDSRVVYDATYGKEIRRRRRAYYRRNANKVAANFARLKVDLNEDRSQPTPPAPEEPASVDRGPVEAGPPPKDEVEGHATESGKTTSNVTYTRSAPPKLRAGTRQPRNRSPQ